MLALVALADAGPLRAVDLDVTAWAASAYCPYDDVAAHRAREAEAERREDAALAVMLADAENAVDPTPILRAVLEHPWSPGAGVAAWRLGRAGDAEALALARAVWPELEP